MSSTPRPSTVRPRFCPDCRKFTDLIRESTSEKNNGRWFYSCDACRKASEDGLLGTRKIKKNPKEGQNIGDVVNKDATWLGFVDEPSFVYGTKKTHETAFFSQPRNKNYGRHWADGIDKDVSVEMAIWLYDCAEAVKNKKPIPPQPTEETSLSENPQTHYYNNAAAQQQQTTASTTNNNHRQNLLLPPADVERLQTYIDTRLKEFEERFTSDCEKIAQAVVTAINNNNNDGSKAVDNGIVDEHRLLDLGVPSTQILRPKKSAPRKRPLQETAPEPGDRMDKKQNASEDVSNVDKPTQRPVEHLRPQKSLGVGLNVDEFCDMWLDNAEQQQLY